LAVNDDAGKSVAVYDTTTGQRVDAFDAPQHGLTYEAVAGTRDGRTFVAAAAPEAGPSCETHLFRLRIDSQGRTQRITELPEVLPGERVGQLVVTPDGREMGYVADGCGDSGAVGVIDLDSGQTHSWSLSPFVTNAMIPSLSLSADGRLLVFTDHAIRRLSQAEAAKLKGADAVTAATNVRLLDTSAATGSADVRSRIVLAAQEPSGTDISSAVISPDATEILVTRLGESHSPDGVVEEYDLNGQRVQLSRRWRQSVDVATIDAVDASGRWLLTGRGHGLGQFDLVTGRYRELLDTGQAHHTFISAAWQG